MQFRKRLCDKGLQSYGHFCAQMQSKSQKRIENTFQAIVKKVDFLHFLAFASGVLVCTVSDYKLAYVIVIRNISTATPYVTKTLMAHSCITV